MSDLIDRQAALDIINADKTAPNTPFITPTAKRDFEIYDSACDRHIKMIGEMPSAQPEIIRCKDCKHYDPNDHCYLQGAEADDFCSYAERREE